MTNAIQPAVLVHGGAGRHLPGDDVSAHERGCLEAARRGWSVLRQGGSALDAAVEAVVALEDNPLFNAGTGGALNRDGEVELDAAVMDGRELRAGGVGALRGFANPIRIAREVMEKSPHLLLVGEGAARFAEACGHAPCDPSLLITQRARNRLAAARAASPENPFKAGTVGAVVLDGLGRVAAATSTGGITGKLPGRVGDSPLVGSGTYADELSGAGSATGHGEAIIRVVWTKHACDLMRAGATPHLAAEQSLRELARVNGEGGIILIDRLGRRGFAFNTERMSRAWCSAEGEGSGYFR